jgi:transcriptional regulator with XRE-family HTH domain
MLTLRTRIGLTQTELAEQLGVSRQAVADWERVTGFGIVDGVGHIGGGLGLLAIAPILPQIGVFPSFLLIAGFLIVAAIIAQFGVNTRGKALEDVSP